MKPGLRLTLAAACCCFACVLLAEEKDLAGSFIDRMGWWGESPDFRRIAPIVAYGLVTANDPVGSESMAVRLPGMRLQRRRVTFRLEGALRGDPGKVNAEVRFDYYAAAHPDAWRYHKQMFEAEVGQRYLFYLFEDQIAGPPGYSPERSGQLRSIGDVGPFMRRIYAGRQAAYTEAEETVRAQLFDKRFAELFLKPGDGLEAEAFVHSLGSNLSYVLSSTGSVHAYQLLRNLLLRSEYSIRKEARVQLMKHYDGQTGCYETLRNEALLSAWDKKRLEEQYRNSIARDARLLRIYEDPAQLPCLSGAMFRSCEEDFATLTILLQHPNAKLRGLACTAVKRYFAYTDTAEQCVLPAKPYARCILTGRLAVLPRISQRCFILPTSPAGRCIPMILHLPR